MIALGTALQYSDEYEFTSDSLLDSSAIEELLTEVSSNSLALVLYQPPCGEFPEPANDASLTSHSVLLWGLTTVSLAVLFSLLTIAYLGSTHGRSKSPATAIQKQTRFSELTASIASLTAAFDSSSGQMASLEAGQAALQRHAEDSQARPNAVNRPPVSAPAPVPRPPVAVPWSAPSIVPAAREIQNGHHHLDSITGLSLIRGAAEHHNANGAIDYWLAPRAEGSSRRMVRVRPFDSSQLGAWVHDLEDGEDYILTPGGGWLKGGAAY